MSRDYSIGTRVRWTSHGRHGFTRKEGRVYWVVPAGQAVSAISRSDKYKANVIRKETSYVVEVVLPSGRKTYYRPQTKHLKQIRS